MARVEFQRHLRRVQEEVLVMGSMVEEAIKLSLQALKNRDLALAREVIAHDLEINKKRFEIEEHSINLIATQQPLASDLRMLVAVLNIIIELERMGDYAEGIGKIVLLLGDEPPVKPLVRIPLMAQKAQGMLHRSLDSLVNRDVAGARRLFDDDDEVDALYDEVYRQLVSIMVNDPSTIDRATHLLWVTHNLERIADRTTNIAERVVYLVTGKMEELKVSKY